MDFRKEAHHTKSRAIKMTSQSHTTSSTLKAGMYSALIKASTLVFGIASTVILTRVLTESALGTWAQFLLISSIIEIIRQSMVRNALIRFYHVAKEEDRDAVFAAAMWLNVFITSVSSVALVVLAFFNIEAPLNAAGLNEMLLWFIPGNILIGVSTYFEWRMAVYPNFKPVFHALFIRQMIALSLVIYLAFGFLEMSGVALVWAYNAGIIASALFIFWRHFSVFQFRWQWHAAWVSKFVHYSKYVVGTNAASSVFRTTDHFMTSILISSAMVAPLSICARLTNIIDIPSQVLADVLFPKSAALHAGGGNNEVGALYERAVGIGLAIVVPAALVVITVPGIFLYLIGGEKYTSYTQLLQLCVCVSFFMPFLRQFGTLLDSTGRPHINMMMMMTLMSVSVIACYVFITSFGLKGAAYGVLTAHAVVFIINQIIMHRLFQVSIPRIFKQMIYAYEYLFGIAKSKLAWVK